MPVDELTCRRWERPLADAIGLLAPIASAAFDSSDAAYIPDRLRLAIDPELWIAEAGETPVGFKLGYRRGPDLFYSWLGGVLPAWQRRGIASALMARQHAALPMLGYRAVETRARAANNAMLILNLRHGFTIVGHEIDARGFAVVTLRKELA